MPPEKDVQVLVRMSSEMAHALDAYRRVAPDLPTRPEAMRQLVIEALEARGLRKPLPVKPRRD
jgi:hypothetical protein